MAGVLRARRGEAPCGTGLCFARFPLGQCVQHPGHAVACWFVARPAGCCVFSTLRTLTRLAMQPSSVINRLIEPEMALAYGGNRHDVFRRLFNRSCQVALWMSAASCIALGVAGERVLGIWTHGKVTMDWPLYTLLLLSAAANTVWYTALMAAYATNRHVRVALVYSAIYGGGAFVLAYIFANSQVLRVWAWHYC